MTRNDEPDDNDSLDEWDQADDGSEDVEIEDPCPNCGRLIYMDAVRCPHCGEYVADVPPGRVSSVPAWVTLTAIGLLVILLFLWVL